MIASDAVGVIHKEVGEISEKFILPDLLDLPVKPDPMNDSSPLLFTDAAPRD